MKCPFCKSANPDGRENCVSCGRPLLDIHGLMSRDRWVGKALRVSLFGIFLGALLGAVVGFLVERPGGEFNDMFDGAWAGAWLGGILIGFLAFVIGVLYYRLKR